MPTIDGNVCVKTPTVFNNCVVGQQASQSFSGPGYQMNQSLTTDPTSTVALSGNQPTGRVSIGSSSVTEWANVPPPAVLSFGLLFDFEALPESSGLTKEIGMLSIATMQLLQLNPSGEFSKIESIFVYMSLSGFSSGLTPIRATVDSVNGVFSMSAGSNASGGFAVIHERILPSGVANENLLTFQFTKGIVDISTNSLGVALPVIGEDAYFSIPIPNTFQIALGGFASGEPINQRLNIAQSVSLALAVSNEPEPPTPAPSIPEPSTLAMAAGAFAMMIWWRKANPKL